MKRHGGLFDQIADLEMLRHAHRCARKGKAHYKEVKKVNADEDAYLVPLHDMLMKGQFTTSPYTVMEKSDGRKLRTLYKLPYYPDRIVQHAIVAVCGPIWTRSYIRDTYQSIIGRGTSDARRRVTKHIKGSQGLYALKFDIKKYYPSIDHDVLRATVRQKIKCERTMALLNDIIKSADGIPIGNYTSQHFGNLYLSAFDWWVKQELKPVGYFRYCDDIVVLCRSAHECHEMRKIMFAKLAEQFHLEVKGDWQVYSVDKEGLDFVGYRFWPDRVELRKNIVAGLKAKAAKIRTNSPKMKQPQAVNGLMSYWGYVKHANAKALWKSQVDEKVLSVLDSFNMKQNPARRVMS